MYRNNITSEYELLNDLEHLNFWHFEIYESNQKHLFHPGGIS